MGSVLLIAIFLFTYESNPEFELAPVTENTLELWDPQKLILNNDKADELVKSGITTISDLRKNNNVLNDINLTIKKGEKKVIYLLLIKLIILSLIIISLSGPRLSSKTIESNMEIIDIMLVVDQSSSMLAMDFEPNRLGAVKEVAKSFIAERDGDRLGTVSYTHLTLPTKA